MSNHPNRGWRSRWTVDLDAATATHVDGWVFKFSPADDEPGAFDGECIGHPEKLDTGHVKNAARIARESGEIFMEARAKRH